MDNKRAVDIINSLGVIEVLHHGSVVWIEQVEGSFAEIKYIDSEQRNRVPLSELMENNYS